MSDVRTLYGKKIVPHHMLNFAEQVYDILAGEIQMGRWKVNDRLPGVIQLASELGFGTKTVQTAYDRLKQDGYVKTRGYRGTFLKSQRPLMAAEGGKIGVLVSAEQSGDPLILWYQHVILGAARGKGMITEVRVVPDGMDGLRALHKGALFGDDVPGVLSLTAFRIPVRYGDEQGLLPAAFLCPPYERCTPKVCADVREAYYDLTSRLIRGGHRNIVFSEDSVEPDPRQTVMHREGYLEAMAEHRLEVQETIMRASRKVRNTDLVSVADHLKEMVRIKRPLRPTAVVAGSLGRNMALAKVAPLQRIAIPRDLSIVAIGSAGLDGAGGPHLTGMLPDFDRMVDWCLMMIEQQRQTGRCDFTKIHVRMHFVEGHTMRPLTAQPADREARRTDRVA
jgi:hypothetical protein